jgi:hypothetical protein
MEPQPWMSPNAISLLVKFTKYFQAKHVQVQTNIVWFFTFMMNLWFWFSKFEIKNFQFWKFWFHKFYMESLGIWEFELNYDSGFENQT